MVRSAEVTVAMIHSAGPRLHARKQHDRVSHGVSAALRPLAFGATLRWIEAMTMTGVPDAREGGADRVT